MSTTAPDRSDAQPADFVRAAWHAVKRGPLTVFAKLALDFSTQILSTVVTVLTLVALLLAVVGGPNTQWVVGFFGLMAASTAIYLAMDAFVMAGVWGHGARTLQPSRPRGGVSSFVRDAFDLFGSALLLRTLNFGTRLAIVALFFGWVIPFAELATRAGGMWGSPVWVPAAIAAIAATIYSLGAALFILTVEMTAPSYFIGGRRLGDAIGEAAGIVLESPLVVYRVFVTALSVLLPALFLAWGASIAYALTFEMVEIAPLTALLRTLANLFLFASIGLFIVVLQYSFFAYYAHRAGRLTDLPTSIFGSETKKERRAVTLSQVIPDASQIVHRVSMRDMLEHTRLSDSSDTPAKSVEMAPVDETSPTADPDVTGEPESGEPPQQDGQNGDSTPSE